MAKIKNPPIQLPRYIEIMHCAAGLVDKADSKNIESPAGYLKMSLKTARRTYPLMIHRLGKYEPMHQATIIANGYGYADWVGQLDALIDKLGIDAAQVAPKIVQMNYSHPRDRFNRKLAEILAGVAGKEDRRLKTKIGMVLAKFNNPKSFYQLIEDLL